MTAVLPFAGPQARRDPSTPELAIEVATLDEPGWSLVIDLRGTPLASRPHREFTIERGGHNWLHAWVDSHEFHIDCGPGNLTEAINTFTSWASEPLQLAA